MALKLEDLLNSETLLYAAHSGVLVINVENDVPLNGVADRPRGKISYIMVGTKLHLLAIVGPDYRQGESKSLRVRLKSRPGSYWHERSKRRIDELIDWVYGTHETQKRARITDEAKSAGQAAV